MITTGCSREAVREAIALDVTVVVNPSPKIILLTARETAPFVLIISISGSVSGMTTNFTVWSVVVVKNRKPKPIVKTAQESVLSADIHPMNTPGSITEKNMPTTTVYAVHNVLRSVKKITFTEMTETVLFVAMLLRMSTSGNGTETNRTILGSILWSVPAVQAHRNLINFLRGTAK
jgi:hypothetical protein